MAETNAERLARLLKVYVPELSKWVDAGEWGPAGCPYVFKTLADGRQQLLIENRSTGDRIGVVGKSRSELLDALEAKLGGK